MDEYILSGARGHLKWRRQYNTNALLYSVQERRTDTFEDKSYLDRYRIYHHRVPSLSLDSRN